MNLKRLLLLLVFCGSMVGGLQAQTNCTDLIYVSPTGNAIGSGSIGDPVTLARALQLVTPTRHHVKMLNGIYSYAQKFILPSNTVLDGRYEIIGGEWVKNSSLNTVLNIAAPFETASGVGHYIALQLNGVTEVYIKDITLNNTTNAAGTTSSKGRTVYGIHVSNTTNFYFTRLNISVGNASNGANGAGGANGFNGANGGTGHTGDVDGVNCNNGNTGTGGTGAGGGGGGGFGSSTCNGTTTGSIGGTAGVFRAGGGGGGGGAGGHENEPNIDGRPGGRGGNGGGGAAFGNGGGGGNGSSSSCSIANGGGGQAGAAGAAGANATAVAPAATFAQYFIPGNQAAQGGDGAGGGGGGGGGGGSGQADDNSGFFGCIVDDGGGSGGGGGGGGGQGGQGGFGGFGGGGSFGVYAESANTGAFLRDLAITIGAAGSGGTGGVGGTGGNGGNGGANGGGCSGSETGCGAFGGAGGRGGNGGNGRTGANGVANAVRGQTLTGTTVPNPRVITAAMYGGCTNSEIVITKNAGTWTLQPSASYINNLTAASSVYNNASNTAILTYSSVGHKDLMVDGINYRNYVYIRNSRALPTFAATMQTVICEGDVFTMNTPTSGLEYEWVLFDAANTTATPVAIFNTSVASWNTPVTGVTTNYSVRLRTKDACCGWSAPVYFNVTVASTSAGPTATGATICAGQTATLSATAAGSGTVDWFADPLGQILLQSSAGPTTNFTTPVLTQSTVYYVGEGIAGCIGTLTSVPVTVIPLPNPPAGTSTPVCQGENVILNGFGSGGTLSWFNVPSGGAALGTGTSYNAGALAAGSYTFYLSENNGTCNSMRAAVAATVNALPAAPTASGTAICEGENATLTATAAGTIEWYADAGLTNLLAVGSSYTTPNLTTTTTYHTAQIDANGCASAGTAVTVTVNAAPAAPAGTGTTVCMGETATLTAVGAGGTLDWYGDASSTAVLGTGTNFTTPALTQTTTYYVGETSAAGCAGALTAVTATVNPLPAAPAASSNAVCEGADVILNGSGSGGTLSWFNVPTGGVALGTGTSYNAGALTAGSYTFYVSENDGTCNSGRTPVAAVVNANPAAPTAVGTAICENASATLTATGANTIQWYADAALTNLLATGSSYVIPVLTATTTYHVAQVNANGCVSTATAVTVTVNPAPAAPAGTGTTVCMGETATLTAVGAGGTLDWYGDASGTAVLGTGANFTTPALTQTTTYYVGETSAAGCAGALTAVTATINPLPAAPAASSNAVCEGADVILNGSGSGGTLSWFNVPTGGVALGTGTSYNAGALTAGSYTFYVSENDGTCNSGRTPVAAVVNANPAAPTAVGTTICENASATLTATGANTIQWYADAALTNLLATGSSYATPVLTATTTYHVAQVNANGCVSAATAVTVTVNPAPAAPAGTGTTVCMGETATLTAVGAGGTLDWYGDASGTAVLGTGANFTTPALTQTTTYYVGETSAAGCAGALTAVTATVNPLPAAPAASSNAVCEGADVILNGSGSGGTLSWFNVPTGGVALGTGTSYNAGALTAGSYTFYVSENDGTCNSGRTPVAAVVNANPAASTAVGTTICENASATLTATGANTIQWYADAALTNLLATGSSYATPALTTTTTYHVAQVNANGCVSAATAVTVTVNPAPAMPTAQNDTVCSGGVAILTASGGTGTLNWYADASGTSLLATGTSLTVSPITQPTSYYVNETDANGCMSAMATAMVLVNPMPNAPAAADITSCEGTTITLSATGSGTGDIVFYNGAGVEIGRGTMSTGNTTITFNAGALAAGTYNYFAVEDRGTGCASTQASIVVNVLTAPTTPTVMNDGPACEGEDIFLQASTIQGAVYYWTGPNGFNSSLQNVLLTNITASQTGTYTVTAMLNGCNSTAATTTIAVNANPVITGGITNNGPLCEGENLLLTAPSIAGVNYDWTGPNGFSDNQAITGVIGVNEPDHQGFYTLVVIDNTTGCESAPLSTLVQINRLPQPGMAFSNSPLCAGETLELSVPEVFGATYSWTGPNGFTSNSRTPQVVNADANAIGTYTVVVSIDDCSASLAVNVIIDTVPNTTIIPDTTVMEGDELVLYATGGILYQWGPVDYLSAPSAPTPVFGGAPVGVYTYSVSIQDTRGCASIEKVTVTVIPRDDIIITDLFTPNGDGINDTWVIDFLQNVEPYTMQIFSRGGLEVFYSENYTNDWDGTHYKTGQRLPDGTYYYLIRTQAKNYSGAVTIKR